MSRYHNALSWEMLKIRCTLLKISAIPLAYLAARTHGLHEEADAILAAAGLTEPPPIFPNAQLLKAPTPIIRQPDSNWPLLTVSKNMFEGTITQNTSSISAPVASMDDPDFANAGDWGDEDLDIPEITGDRAKPNTATANVVSNGAAHSPGEESGEGWDIELDLDIPLDDMIDGGANAVQFNPPAAASSRQIGIIDFTPLKPHFCNLSVFPLVFTCYYICTGVFTPQVLINRLQEAYQGFTSGKFADAEVSFRTILHQIVLTVVERHAEVDEVQQLMAVCREYLIGLKLQLARRELGDSDPKRGVELAAYFSHCQLQACTSTTCSKHGNASFLQN
ncbi:hypothetical protein BSLG_005541 [Batrachochytrium salamandrivorans]|nr:hypothetical protein BSLG_005541 [Batrachochytrium salamandrivorans]